MSTHYNTKIPTDGLILLVDPANTKSYPGTGTEVTDLISAGTGDFSGTPSWDSTNSGRFIFSASGDAIEFPEITWSTDHTWSFWARCTDATASINMFAGQYLPYFSWNSDGRFLFYYSLDTHESVYGEASLVEDTWNHFVATIEYSDPNTTARVYVNGEFLNIGVDSGVLEQYSYPFNLGDGRDTAWYPFKGYVGHSAIWNRALTDDEVMSVFNATRGRYGI